MSQQIELKIPDIGGHAGVDVIEVSVKVGDRVEKDDTLVTLETDKATMDVPAEAAGVVKEVRVKVGDKVGEGDVIVLLEAESAAAAPVAAPAAATPAAAPVAVAPAPVAAAPAAPAAAGGRQTLTVPDIGGHDGVDVIDVAVKAGDRIAVDDTLITLETDKATMDVPATAAGLVVEVKVRVGDKVGEGAAIVVIEAEGQAAASPAAAPAPVAAPAAVVTAPAASPVVAAAPRAVAPVDQVAFVSAHAGPSVRRLARELGVDLSKVSGTGRKNRITESDVKTFVKGVLQNPAAAVAAAPVNGSGLDLLPWPKVDFARFGPVTSEPLSRIKKISGANLSRNWVMIPHVTQFDEADITDMEAFRKQMGEELKADGVKLTPLAFLIKAAVKALQKFPAFNASLDGDNLVLKQYVNIGFAADTPNGLVVPVVKDADRKSLIEIAQETGVLAKKARDGKLLPGDMQGGCFSISSLGGIGGTAFTPIINAPEVAILGVSKSAIKPVWNGKEFAPRLMLPLSLSYDHRVIDGAAAARFTSYLSQVLGDIRRLML
ncbi:pyruvate dehydrogenase E2 component (dihydrolipoamide acetyltransferase) [Microvirgula sp. AG722]|uniref:dihydrolipoyllysine-residue acetyltransferase n=1 Tax=Microvirgula sp. AG722 TaxID=2183901 RepID=UPI000DC293F4|nr:dihydrolipoyllysine-residue acetyltransferase [Microvirgula sp. AG722]RAS11433.1 pyruvate dehydrogenase E2 component (dihydrolipoamide acetyltransferase) [Microvirgula sp. AG722]